MPPWPTWGTWRRAMSIHEVQTQDLAKTQKSSWNPLLLNQNLVLQKEGFKSWVLKKKCDRGYQKWIWWRFTQNSWFGSSLLLICGKTLFYWICGPLFTLFYSSYTQYKWHKVDFPAPIHVNMCLTLYRGWDLVATHWVIDFDFDLIKTACFLIFLVWT